MLSFATFFWAILSFLFHTLQTSFIFGNGGSSTCTLFCPFSCQENVVRHICPLLTVTHWSLVGLNMQSQENALQGVFLDYFSEYSPASGWTLILVSTRRTRVQLPQNMFILHLWKCAPQFVSALRLLKLCTILCINPNNPYSYFIYNFE